MSVSMKNDCEPKKCNLNISFDLDDVFGYPMNIEEKSVDNNESHKSQIECASKDVDDENVSEHENFKVSLHVSFDHTDLEPISIRKELFSTEQKSPISRGIS